MNEYDEFCAEFIAVETLADHIRNIGAIRNRCEDTNLINILDNCIHELRFAHANKKKGYNTPSSLVDFQATRVQTAYDYCSKYRTLQVIPWEVSARNAGWTPPAKPSGILPRSL